VNQQQLKEIMGGKQQGPVAGAVRGLLRCGALGYGIGVTLRNGLFTRGVFKQVKVPAKVISVGNLTAGGTGKTPLVVWLCQKLADTTQMAILTRGYKSGDAKTAGGEAALGDEPALLARACPDVPVVVNPDRVAGAREAIEACQAEVLILDDGFQHRRLRRDLDIVTIDATCPFGYDRLLPAGLLREPVSALQRAQAAVVTRCDQVSVNTREDILKTLHQVNPLLAIAQTRHDPTTIQGPAISTFPAGALKGHRIFAFCGLGNPDAFYQTLRVLGAQLVGTFSFDDHHHCTERELRGLQEQAQRTRADLILTTEKNWIGLPALKGPAEIPLAYLGMELGFLTGEAELVELVETTLPSAAS
jgi:tetraacyldisaccharide 4'-kinase